MTLTREGPWLIARLPGPHRALSWAVVGGGLTETDAVAWLKVSNVDLGLDVDPVRLLEQRIEAAGLGGAVGLLTSANLDRFVEAVVEHEGLRAHAVATVGLSNALRVGDTPGGRRVGTINLLVVLSAPLDEAGLIEAMSIATEARTVAVLEAGVPSVRSGRTASGTGTDCVVIAASLASEGARYAGKHTAIGHVVGEAALRAIAQGTTAWVARNRPDLPRPGATP